MAECLDGPKCWHQMHVHNLEEIKNGHNPEADTFVDSFGVGVLAL